MMENTIDKDFSTTEEESSTANFEQQTKTDESQTDVSAESSADNSKNDNSETPEELIRKELALANDKYIRLYSEFDNFRRRTAKEKIDLMNNGAADFFKMMLPVVDDFERALKSINEASDVEALKQGVDLIYNKFKNTLTAKGLKEMESKEQVFDADLHEAITQIPAPSEDLKGKVIDELEKGYYLNDKVIRYAKVVVGN